MMSVIATCYIAIFSIAGAHEDTGSSDACSRHMYQDLCAQWFDCQWCPNIGKGSACQSRHEECPRQSVEGADEVLSPPAAPDIGASDACSRHIYQDLCAQWFDCRWCPNSGACQSRLEECPRESVEEADEVLSPPAAPDTGSNDACSRHIYKDLCAQWFDCQWCPNSGACQSRLEECPQMLRGQMRVMSPSHSPSSRNETSVNARKTAATIV